MPRIKLHYCHRKSLCRFCWNDITLGQPVVKVWFQPDKNPSGFHLQCFYDKVQTWFDRHPYVPPKRRRRECPPELREQYKRLTNKIRYHRNKGHDDKVKLLQEELNELRW